VKKLLVFVLALAVLGCGKKAENPEEPAKAAEPAKPEVKVEKLGMALAGAEEVDVLELLKNPSAYEGKTICENCLKKLPPKEREKAVQAKPVRTGKTTKEISLLILLPIIGFITSALLS